MLKRSRSTKLKKDLVFAAVAICAVTSASMLGQIATYPNLFPWYASLTKPSFNPPSWVFAPVWTILYALMAFALWRILRLPDAMPRRSMALRLFFLQLALNAAWSWMFFWAHSPLLGLINILPQLLFVILTLAVVVYLDPLAAWCLVPLATWVTFASILNFSIWWLNS